MSRTTGEPLTHAFGEYLRTLDCVHCGLCLPACPTYAVTLREAESPRGRVYLLRGLAEGRFDGSPQVDRHLSECIVCRACEAACPSGLRMSDIVESYRQSRGRPAARRSATALGASLLLRHVIPYRGRIAALTELLYLYQRTGLRRIVRAVLRRTSRRLSRLDDMLPPIPPPSTRFIETERTRPQGYQAAGATRLRAGLFLGCIASEWFAGTHQATIRVLVRNGVDVIVPEAQTCCGALHRHAGRMAEAEALFRQNAEAFEEAGVDVVVVNAAGCGAALKEPPPGLDRPFSVPVRDVCEFLDEIGIVAPERRMEKTVAYHQPCHLVHAQRVGPGAVLRLLGMVPGIRLVPLRESDLCCGSGGVYTLVHPEMADLLLDRKVEAIRESGAEIIVTGNPGCLLQLRSRLSATSLELLHPVELLDRSYGEPHVGTKASGRSG
jgi:glycolate oxidase iron-sulfur subunit